jgi:hypothetical protein
MGALRGCTVLVLDGQRLMRAAEVVVHEVQAHRVGQVLDPGSELASELL